MKMTGADLAEMASARKSKGHMRLSQYSRSRTAYFGDSYDSLIRPMDAQGRPLMRHQQIRDALSSRGGAPNMLMPIVDDFVALKGVLPIMKVMPWDESDEAREKAAKFSRVLRTQWTQSHMDLHAYRMAWMLSTLGDCLITLTPVFPAQATPLMPAGVYLNVVDPATSFPQFKLGWESEELQDVIVWEKLPRDQVKSRWGIAHKDEKVDVFWYISDDWNCVSVGSRIVEQVEHNLGYCPAQWIKNKLNGRPAQSDIAAAIDAHDEMQVMVLVMNDSLLESTYSQLVIKNPVSMNEQFEIGPGADPIVLQADGDVSRLAPSPPPQSAQMLMQNMWELIQRIAGSAPVRTENAIPGSNVSGRSVNAQQGPMETRLAASQTVIGYHYQSANSKVLHMLYHLDGFKDEVMNIYGTEKGRPYSIAFRGEELDGWTRNTVQWSALIGQSTQERSLVGLSLKQADLVPDEWVLEQIGIEDSSLLIKEARQEAKDKQAAMQPPGGGAPGGPGQPEAGGPQGQPGGGNGASVQPPPGAPPPFPPVDTSPVAMGMGVPQPVPDVAGQIQQVLQQVGDQVTGQVTNVQPIPGGVRVTIADGSDRDRQLLRQAFQQAGFERVVFQRAEVI